MRAALIAGSVIAIAALAPAARAGEPDDEPDGESQVGLGFGTALAVEGDLARHFAPANASGRVRMGGRFGRLGVELVLSVAGLKSDLPGDPGAVLWGTELAYHVVSNPWFHLGARAGLGYGGIDGMRETRPHTCDPDEDPCVPVETVDTSYPGFALDVGATVQVELGRRRGGRAILWADVGTAFARFQLPDGVASGRITTLTFGICHGMRF